jgi:alpha-N-acetylglucosaminidase
VWYNKKDWEGFIDWLSVTGINNILALTGQEEIQYQVFRELGVQDEDIRSWFNGPAFLTWSRGQNEYGNNICGPLPKHSWMKAQYDLQRSFILPRLRSLGIVGQLPGFQGNVPIQLRDIFKDANITQQGATGWMDSLDPLYGYIADLYMKKLIAAFGTDHWYQLDGYFNGATAPWLTNHYHEDEGEQSFVVPSGLVGSSQIGPRHHDDAWFRRGSAVYQGLQRTDPDAIWSFQGFSFISWDDDSIDQAMALKGFIDAAPPGHFVIIDMSYTGMGEWQKFHNASFFGSPFIWTALHDFGGTDGIKGDMRRLNRIPFDLTTKTSIVGLGGTPEGIDQNPAYYNFLFESNFRTAPVSDLSAHMSRRKVKQYGLLSNDTSNMYSTISTYVTQSWTLLMQSLYSTEMSVQDNTGIAHLTPRSSLFENDRYSPQPMLCQVFHAWKSLLMAVRAAASIGSDIFVNNNEPFRYDIVNLGREVLAQLSSPAAANFSDATKRQPRMDRDELLKSGFFYIQLLNDTNTLVSTDQAFLLGPWIHSAKQWGANDNYSDDSADVIYGKDCYSSMLQSNDCQHFYEWNARNQITTWNPTPKDSATIPGGPIDYAAKHWAGLIQDYYGVRASILLRQALKDHAAEQSLNQTRVERLFAQHAYKWTTATNAYSTVETGDALNVSFHMFYKYKDWFSSCDEQFVKLTTASTK